MKPRPIISGIIILCLSLFLKGHAQSITLTFSGGKDGQPVALDHILIENCDKGCDTTLYYPNASLTLQPLGIGDQPSDPAGFTVFQNIPNPATGHTAIKVYQPVTGQASVMVTDLTGRQVASFSGELKRGYHVFSFAPGRADAYVFSAGNSEVTRSIVIVSGTPSRDGSCTLNYAGMPPGEEALKSTTPAGGFRFSLGDHLRYTGYYTTFTSVIEDTPHTNMSYTFDFSTTGNPCPGIPTVTYGGQVYHTVKIGNQCWFRENLNIGTRINGIAEQTDNGIMEKYCYDDLESNCETYGGLYQWNELMQYVTTEGAKGLCPDGWHIPTETEWAILTDYLGGSSIAGGKMKEAGISHWVSPNTGATNSSGFTALPGGFWGYNGEFNDLTGNATFWSSSQHDAPLAWYRRLSVSYESVSRDDYVKAGGFSGRCLQD